MVRLMRMMMVMVVVVMQEGRLSPGSRWAQLPQFQDLQLARVRRDTIVKGTQHHHLLVCWYAMKSKKKTQTHTHTQRERERKRGREKSRQRPQADEGSSSEREEESIFLGDPMRSQVVNGVNQETMVHQDMEQGKTARRQHR